MTLVNEGERIIRKIIKERGRGFSLGTTRDVPRVVLDAMAIPDLADHLEIEHRPLVQPLGFQQPAVAFEMTAPLGKLGFDPFRRFDRSVAGCDEV